MARWRRFERSDTAGGTAEFREIRLEGIRCHLRWSAGKNVRASTSAFDDEVRASRAEARKAAEWIRKGFVEVELPADGGAAEAEAMVLDVIQASVKHGVHPGFTPVPGFEETFHCELTPGHPSSHHNYYVLRDRGRSAISFNVLAATHDAEAVAEFLEFVTAHRELPFDGDSHHKVALPKPVGGLSHVLFCSPALGRSHRAHLAIADRVASAFPIFDCEIGDADTEVLVDARIHGHGSLPHSRWVRGPKPVVDLRFDVQPSFYRPQSKFLVFQPSDLENLLHALPAATPESWLELRSFRGDVACFTPESAPAYADVLGRLSVRWTAPAFYSSLASG
ncbi:hypothetical protein KDL01_15800 [Actinospica durhamensis]|uniref:WGR domain-containing protein n=1 Tax=Actinospica durhamensis TaxID=1508375 RepID=A0A941EVK5_9ACTN|nr:hypothetical protein [Actinospica durhamensis]MBR7834739.1 hypothetical protein [Actinospica durhamensis]